MLKLAEGLFEAKFGQLFEGVGELSVRGHR